MPNIAYMSVLLVALLVWLVGVPVGFWLLAAIYPSRMHKLLRKSASLDQSTSLMAPVTRLARSGNAAPAGAPPKLG